MLGLIVKNESKLILNVLLMVVQSSPASTPITWLHTTDDYVFWNPPVYVNDPINQNKEI